MLTSKNVAVPLHSNDVNQFDSATVRVQRTEDEHRFSSIYAGYSRLRMHTKPDSRRILLIDDNPAIHQDFRKIFGRPASSETALSESEAALFGPAKAARARPEFRIDSALQREQGVDLVRQALRDKRPYALAFVDVRMPPGCDGIETIIRLWEADPAVQIVICTAHSDYSWEETLERLGRADSFIVLKKPFDSIEVLQLAEALTEKWRLARHEQRRLQDLERQILEHNRDLQVARNINAQLDAANKKLAAPVEGVADTQVRRARSLERDLRSALQTGELTLHYQPIVEIASRRVSSLEALVRWKHPTLGSISPGDFIPMAEETGLIVPLGEYVLRTACAQVMQWQREQVPVVRVAINLSSLQLQGQPIGELVRGIVRETGMQPVLSKIEGENGSRRFTMIVAQHPAESLAAFDCEVRVTYSAERSQQTVFQPLMIALAVIVRHVMADRTLERCLPEEDHSAQTLLFDRAHEPFGEGIQIGRSWRQSDNPDTLSDEHAAEGLGVFRVPIEN
jgi:CheY-like chemotaxis protein